MIEINFEISKQRMALKMNGHAGSGEVGHDLVCACASILAYTTAQMAKEFELRNKLLQCPLIRLSEGDARIVVKPKTKDVDEIWHTFNTIQAGFILLENNYPKFIKIIRK